MTLAELDKEMLDCIRLDMLGTSSESDAETEHITESLNDVGTPPMGKERIMNSSKEKVRFRDAMLNPSVRFVQFDGTDCVDDEVQRRAKKRRVMASVNIPLAEQALSGGPVRDEVIAEEADELRKRHNPIEYLTQEQQRAADKGMTLDRPLGQIDGEHRTRCPVPRLGDADARRVDPDSDNPLMTRLL